MATRYQSSIQAQTDRLITKSSGVFTSQPGTGINCSSASEVTGFLLSASAPTGTGIYYAFKTADYWFRLDNAGGMQAFSSTEPDFDTLKANGNTTAELLALTDIPAFAHHTVMIAIGMEAEDLTVARPIVNSIGVKYISRDQQNIATQYSAVYELNSGSQLAAVTADTQATGEASVAVTAKVTYEDGTSSDWLSLEQLSGVKATGIQFKGVYTVNTVGYETAQVNSAKIIYADGDTPVTGQENVELYSITQDWYMNVSQCRLTVKHSHLESSDITAYVALRAAPVIVQGEVLGIGTNSKKTFQLKHAGGVKYDTIRLYYDGSRVYSGYEVNTGVGRITCEAPEGVIVTCDYEYGWEGEQWQEMSLSNREIFLDYDQSEYRYVTEDKAKTVCALRLVLHVQNGYTDNYELGTATGGLQTAKLPYSINEGKITLTTNTGQVIDGRDWEILDDPQYIRYTATEGLRVYASYDWCSETPVIYQFAGVFSDSSGNPE